MKPESGSQQTTAGSQLTGWGSQTTGRGWQQAEAVAGIQQALALRCFSHPRRPRPAQAGLKVRRTVIVATSVQRVQKRKLFDIDVIPAMVRVQVSESREFPEGRLIMLVS